MYLMYYKDYPGAIEILRAAFVGLDTRIADLTNFSDPVVPGRTGSGHLTWP